RDFVLLCRERGSHSNPEIARGDDGPIRRIISGSQPINPWLSKVMSTLAVANECSFRDRRIGFCQHHHIRTAQMLGQGLIVDDIAARLLDSNLDEVVVRM